MPYAPAVYRVMASALLLSALACTAAAPALADIIEDRGWLYESPGLVPGNRNQDRNFVYDENGLLVQYDIYDDSGKFEDTAKVDYFDQVYDDQGNLVSATFKDTAGNFGTVSFVAPVGVGGSQEEADSTLTRTAARTNARLVGRRIATLLAPRPAGAAPGGDQDVSYSIELNRAAAVLQGTPAGLAAAPAARGLAAGDGEQRFGAWANGQLTKLDNYEKGARYAGALASAMVGMDYRLLPNLMVGLGLGYEYSKLHTDFNDGFIGASGVTVAPYVGYAILPQLTVDLSGALTYLHYWTERSDLLQLRSSYSAVRSSVSSNLNYYLPLGDWLLSANGGFMYANEYTDDYVESGLLNRRYNRGDTNDYLGEWSTGVRASWFKDFAEPYVALNYYYDTWLSGPKGQDRDEFEAILGLNLQPSQSWLVGMELGHAFGRGEQTATSLMVQARYEF